MSIDLDLVKSHARVTHDLEDDLITMYIDWAKSTVIESVSIDDNVDFDYLEANTQYQKAVIMLSGFFYEQRMPIGEIRAEELPYSVLDAIQKLRGDSRVVLDDE